MGSPIFNPAQVRELVADLRAVFRHVRPFGLYVPLYGTYWGMACVSDALDPCALSSDAAEARIAARGLRDLQYYNGDVHQALFALPNYYRDLVR